MNDPARVPLSKAEQDALVVGNIALVHHYAKQAHGSLDYEDRVSEGTLGLMRAAADFDPGRGCTFGTYASWWIKAFIFRAVNHNLGARSSRTAKIYTGLRRVIHEAELLGIEPSNEYVAKRLEVPTAAVASMRAHVLQGLLYLDAPFNRRGVGDNDINITDFVLNKNGPDTPTPEDVAIAKNAHVNRVASIRVAMRGLLAKEREVLQRRYLTDEPETLNEVGLTWGVTRERVRQIEVRALAKLKRRLEELRKVAK